VIHEYGEPLWNDIDRRELLLIIHQSSGSPTGSHLVANQEKLGGGCDEFGLLNIFCHTSK
jgi:hypothetical protein